MVKIEKQSKEEHIKRHQELHEAFDELLADFITHTKKGLRNTNLLEFIEWSHSQTLNPDEKEV